MSENGKDGGRLCESLLLIWSSHCKRWKMCKLVKCDTAGLVQLILINIREMCHTGLPGRVQPQNVSHCEVVKLFMRNMHPQSHI